jgi:hypothetical protein
MMRATHATNPILVEVELALLTGRSLEQIESEVLAECELDEDSASSTTTTSRSPSSQNLYGGTADLHDFVTRVGKTEWARPFSAANMRTFREDRAGTSGPCRPAHVFTHAHRPGRAEASACASARRSCDRAPCEGAARPASRGSDQRTMRRPT